MATNTIAPRAFAVWWKDLHRWGVKSFQSSQWQWPPTAIKKLATALERRFETVDKTSFELRPEHFLSLRFTGEVEPRDLHGKSEFKGALFFAHAGDIIYSKIDVRNGAIGIVPAAVPVATVTSEFPVYRIKKDVALSEYIQLVFRTEHFRRIINGMVSGASGRKRVQPDDLENVEIPLPPLAEQKAVVARWRKAQDDIASAKARVAAITLELEHGLLNQIGLEIEPPTPQRGAFALFWSDLERWDTFFYRKDFVALKHSLARINRKKLGDLASFISRPWKHESFPDGFFKYVEISSVSKEDGIFSSKVVGLKEAPSRATTLICKGDLIISTTRPYLGAIAIVPEAYDNHVCSSGFALVDPVDDTHILKEYLLFFLKSQGGLKQMEQRMTVGLYPAITQDELEKIEIPLPPLSVQKQIMERVAAGREEIAREREAADRIAREINAEIETLILGTKKVSEL
jgi:restriction endonuclease S subunit